MMIFQSQHNGSRSRCPVRDAWNRSCPAFHFHIGAGCCFRWLELAAAYLSRRDHLFILCLEPLQPIGPPRARMLGCRFEPAFNVRAAVLFTSPILVLWLAGRVDQSSDMARPCNHIFYRPAE